MGQLAFVFSGQGAQTAGMGRALYEGAPAARRVLDALDALHPGLLALCFDGPDELLTQTRHAQPALLAVGLAAAAAAQEAGLVPDCCAGFSLGEWTAAAFAGLISPGRALPLVARRGQWMQECGEQAPGAMSAVLRLDRERVEALCAQHPGVWPANDNAPGQVVVSGTLEALAAFEQALPAAGGRAMRLKVSGAFHSPLMQQAADRLADALAQEELREPAYPLYSNVTARPYGAARAAQLLARQVTSPVRWQDTVRAMADAGVDRFVELGPGGVLCGLIAKIVPQARCARADTPQALQEALTMMGATT